MSVELITTSEFNEIQKGDDLIVVDFYAEWCPPCKMLGPILEEISNEETSPKIFKVNIEEQKELAEKYAISSLPTVIFFKDGKEVDKFVGLLTKEEIEKYISKNK